MAGTTGLEPATSDVTGRRSNQLNYVPFFVCNTSDNGRIAYLKSSRVLYAFFTDIGLE